MAIGVGIVGFGRMAERYHLGLVQSAKGLRVMAVCDMMTARLRVAEKKHNIARTYQDLSEFVRDEAVQLVIITTPTGSHAPLAIECLNAGKHVVVEKPMSMNVAEADEMIATAKKARRVLSVFQNRRWDAPFRTAMKALRSGQLGKILMLRVVDRGYSNVMRTYAVKEFRPLWRTEARYGGGALFEFGAHYLDQLLLLAGSRPVRVYGELYAHRWTKDADDGFLAVVHFKNGVVGQVDFSWAAPAKTATGWQIEGTKRAYQEYEILTPKNGKLSTRKITPLKMTWEAYYRNLAAALQGTEPLAVKPEQIRKVMRLIDAVRDSHRTKSVVEL